MLLEDQDRLIMLSHTSKLSAQLSPTSQSLQSKTSLVDFACAACWWQPAACQAGIAAIALSLPLHAVDTVVAGMFRPNKDGPLQLFVDAAGRRDTSQPGLVFRRRCAWQQLSLHCYVGPATDVRQGIPRARPDTVISPVQKLLCGARAAQAPQCGGRWLVRGHWVPARWLEVLCSCRLCGHHHQRVCTFGAPLCCS